ncbi:MAG TPA: LLM class flavin-dependent oxidoreductase [Acidimicrobiales bacterium]|nr:LLM class flavin-dependent oxidoreductase [Acidimicrobiales bacterium]
MTMKLSAAFATSFDTPEHIRVAEQLGYANAWAYDSPTLYPDVWVALCSAAERTSTIGLGPAVLVPSLRHPMVNAAAIANLASLAPGRTNVAIGAGFTGRYTLGQRAVPWSKVREYVLVLRALLRGEDAEWEGAVIRMLHPQGFAPARPIDDVPILIAADGPKGMAVAAELGDGIFSAARPAQGDGPTWRAVLAFGTVLAEGEQVTDDRVLDAAGHGLAVAYHAMYERGGAAAVDALPGGATWRAAVEAVPDRERHLAVHEDHLVGLTDRDRAALADGGAALLTALSFTGSAAELRDKAAALEAAGATELAYQPAGPDIPGELERMIGALG